MKGIDIKNKHTHGIANIENPEAVLQKLRTWLDDERWPCIEGTDAGRPFITAFAGGQHAGLRIFIHFCDGFHTVFFQAMLSVTIPKTCLPQILEFIELANIEKMMAPLALHLQFNEVCAVTRISLSASELTDIEINAAFEEAARSIDVVTPQVLAIAFGTKKPAEAIKEMHEHDRLTQTNQDSLKISGIRINRWTDWIDQSESNCTVMAASYCATQ